MFSLHIVGQATSCLTARAGTVKVLLSGHIYVTELSRSQPLAVICHRRAARLETEFDVFVRAESNSAAISS